MDKNKNYLTFVLEGGNNPTTRLVDPRIDDDWLTNVIYRASLPDDCFVDVNVGDKTVTNVPCKQDSNGIACFSGATVDQVYRLVRLAAENDRIIDYVGLNSNNFNDLLNMEH